jgi:hypothetical protein
LSIDLTVSSDELRDDALTWRDLWMFAAVTLAVRLVYVLITARAAHLSFYGYAAYGDGHSYLDYARFILGQLHSLDPYDARLFPGFPALIALLHLAGVPLSVAALGLTWVSAAIATPAAAALFRSRRVAWAMVFLPPDYLLITSVASTEGPMLALTLLGLLMAVRGKQWGGAELAGVLLGLAGVVRPMACFAVLGYFVYAHVVGAGRKPVRGWIVGLVAAGVVGLAMLGLRHLFGDAMHGAKAYAGDAYRGNLFTWPFGSLIMTPRRTHVPLLKVALVWAHVLINFLAIAILIWRLRARSRARPLDSLALPWLGGLTAFNLCVGDVWGFQCFARFLTPALPALFDGLGRLLPRRWIGALAFGLPSFALALLFFIRRLHGGV